MKIIGIITTVLISTILTPIWRGYVFSKLWLWFIVGTFGVIPLGIAQSIGIAAVVAFLTHQYDPYEDESKSSSERMAMAVGVAFIAPALALGFGAIVKLWM